MKQLVLSALAVLISTCAVDAHSTAKLPAPSTDVALQKCEALKRQADRNVCITAVIKSATATPAPAAPPPPPERSPEEIAISRAQPVFDAAETIKSVTNSGVSYTQYGPYVQALAIALDRYRSSTETQNERDAAATMNDALVAFQDAGRYWWKEIDFFSRSRNDQTYLFALPISAANTEEFVRKYNLPTRNADLFGFHSGVQRGLGVSTIWSYAVGKTAIARSILDGTDIRKPKVAPAHLAYKAKVGTPTPELSKMIDDAFLKAGCFKASEITEDEPLNGLARFEASCTHGQKQKVTCDEKQCFPYDDTSVLEESMQPNNKS